jgi:alpha-D-ribose 1-methylphosphonate 5-triphosphate diphosphatase
MSDHGGPVLFEGAQVILPDGTARVSVRIEGGRITALDGARDGARVIDARDKILAPALVDIHGDAFERQIMPRPGVSLPVEAAFLETDRQLAANGIATAYHALTLGWEPGLRSVETGWQVHHALQSLAPRLTVENRLQLRWETFCHEALPLIEAALAGPLTPSVAFNDHTTMAVLHADTPLQERPFDFDPALPVADLDSAEFAAKMDGRAKRSHMSPGQFVDLFRAVWQRRPDVPGWIDIVATQARGANAPMLSHDDTQEETRAYFRDRGARITEFPMNRRTALYARTGGDAIVLGAPNAARGGSHLGSIGAADMIGSGLCDILASDYYYPAMLGAVARLLSDRVGALHTLWPLVSANPARASGLVDRGIIAPGLRADLILMDWPEGGIPVVRQTWTAGRLAYSATPLDGY